MKTFEVRLLKTVTMSTILAVQAKNDIDACDIAEKLAEANDTDIEFKGNRLSSPIDWEPEDDKIEIEGSYEQPE